jgi:hypothetical protein
MRATSMRRLVGGAAALMLAGATLLSMSGTALATVPLATATSEAIPATFSPGNDAGFRGALHYQDPSTLAKLYLSIQATGASTADPNKLVDYIGVTKNGSPVAKPCGTPTVSSTSPITITITCSFKTVRLDDVFVALAAFNPADDTLPVSATYAWSTTGSTGSDVGGTSHGDTWPNPLVTVTSNPSTDATNYGGGFSIVNGASFGNLQAVSATNKQATKVTGLPAGLAATVLDGPTLSDDCGPTYQALCDANAIGEWSEVTVGDGQTLSTAFQIVITYYSGTPKSFVHKYVDSAGVTQYEQIFPFDKKNPQIPSFTWSAKDNAATITTYHNGAIRGM